MEFAFAGIGLKLAGEAFMDGAPWRRLKNDSSTRKREDYSV